ncbi:MAG: hypothetical protein VXW31_10580, partial [Planctomycetota bacterium]|nr:hypothetical protein [Planctomycetota bacterium]
MTYEDLVERLAELYEEYEIREYEILVGRVGRVSLYNEARLFFGARADSEWDLNSFLELAGRVEDVFEMVHRLIAHDDVRFYEWLAAIPHYNRRSLLPASAWARKLEDLPREIGRRAGFRSNADWAVHRRRDQSRESAFREKLLSDLDKIKSADLTDIEKDIRHHLDGFRRKFLEDELKAAHEGRRARFDSLSAACETEVPASWAEMMRLYGLLFPEEGDRRPALADFFSKEAMATEMSMEEVLRVRDRIGEIMAFHRESGSGALSSPFYLGRIGAIVGADAVHGADPLAADALTRSLPDHSARRQDFASSRRADQSLKTAEELVAWVAMKESDDGAWPARLTVANVETFFDEEETVLSMDDVIQLADRADFSKAQLVLRGITANQATNLRNRGYVSMTYEVPHGGG